MIGTRGFFVNYKDLQVYSIYEHEQWLRVRGNAEKLMVPSDVISRFSEFEVKRDRIEFLTMVLQNSPAIRVRGQHNRPLSR